MALQTKQFGRVSSKQAQPGHEPLKMLMSSREIMATHEPVAGDYLDEDLEHENPPAALWERKAEEADESGLTQSVSQQGVSNPVNLFKWGGENTVGNGHHRIAAQHDVDPDQPMPVLHHENYESAMHGGYPGTPDQRTHSWTHGAENLSSQFTTSQYNGERS